VRVLLQVLTPVVQHRDNADLGTEVARSSGDGAQRLSHRSIMPPKTESAGPLPATFYEFTVMSRGDRCRSSVR